MFKTKIRLSFLEIHSAMIRAECHRRMSSGRQQQQQVLTPTGSTTSGGLPSENPWESPVLEQQFRMSSSDSGSSQVPSSDDKQQPTFMVQSESFKEVIDTDNGPDLDNEPRWLSVLRGAETELRDHAALYFLHGLVWDEKCFGSPALSAIAEGLRTVESIQMMLKDLGLVLLGGSCNDGKGSNSTSSYRQTTSTMSNITSTGSHDFPLDQIPDGATSWHNQLSNECFPDEPAPGLSSNEHCEALSFFDISLSGSNEPQSDRASLCQMQWSGFDDFPPSLRPFGPENRQPRRRPSEPCLPPPPSPSDATDLHDPRSFDLQTGINTPSFGKGGAPIAAWDMGSNFWQNENTHYQQQQRVEDYFWPIVDA